MPQDNPLNSLDAYSRFIAETLNIPAIVRSTVKVWSDSPSTGIAEGEVVFRNSLRLRLREDLDFDEAIITSYGYEVYRGTQRLYWYDDFPHPEDPGLASTFPHHRHIPPDIRRNRICAPGIDFRQPNLPLIIEEILSQPAE